MPTPSFSPHALTRIIVLVSTLFTLACQKGKVEMQQISINTEGLSFGGIFLDFKTRTINKFRLTGQCQPDIVKVFYRFDSSQEWKEVSSANIDCANSSTFTFDFESDMTTIQKASGYKYDKEKHGKYPVLEFEFYGRTKEYATNVIHLGVTSLIGQGHQGLSISPEATLSNETANLKIRGKLSSYGFEGTPMLKSASFKIRQGQLSTYSH